jgi:hypothetical protein
LGYGVDEERCRHSVHLGREGRVGFRQCGKTPKVFVEGIGLCTTHAHQLGIVQWDTIKKGYDRFICAISYWSTEEFERFCEEATENGCSAYLAPGVNRIYVIKGTNWQWTGVCPACHNKTVTGGRCIDCGWDSRG